MLGTGRSNCMEFADDDLVQFADELRCMWRSLSRGTHLSGGADQTQRQQFWVLGLLENGPQRMSDIAERAHTSQASATGIISRLEERGFVVRIRPEGDRRVVLVDITDEGRAAAKAAHQQTATRLRALLNPLDTDERTQLIYLLNKMNNQNEQENANN